MKLNEQDEIDELESLLKMGRLTAIALYLKLVALSKDEQIVKDLFDTGVRLGALSYHIEKLKEDNREIAESN